ncbi:MAG TPA: alpha/beta hydrolase-fold protein [Holophagaceae bacterium]|nr:alpha/beta hydrolase-fold protein [Holophagaceae bacterium]
MPVTQQGPAIAFRRHGHGPARVLLLHALTGTPDAADREGVKGWWSPLFGSGAPFDAEACTVWTPLLPDSDGATTRNLAASLAAWIEAEDLHFDLLAGGSLGGMVALELAVQAPGRFKSVAVIGCGGRSDAWVRGQVHAERRVLESALPDAEAIALARRFAMLSFRAPRGMDARFAEGGIEAWLDHHGTALAARFTRARYHALLGAMASHDLGRGRGGLVAALKELKCPLHVLGIDTDALFAPALIRELAEAARRAGRFGSLRWLHSPHGHDAFLLEWPQVTAWLDYLLALAPHAEIP